MIKHIITDIEGTTSSISYVKDVMFPYSKQKLRDYIYDNWQQLDFLKEELSKKYNITPSKDMVINVLSDWIDKDLKEGILKNIQGHIWEEGFLKGELKGHIYDDAYEKLKEWKEKGIYLYVYSSGSVKAQKLFFSHTNYGDITYLFDGFFDTNVGSKKDPNSYANILKIIKASPKDTLFLSDVEQELDSALKVGINTILVLRGQDITDSIHSIVRSFYEIDI